VTTVSRAALLLLGLAGLGCAGDPPRPERIRTENARPGEPSWAAEEFFGGDPGFAAYARPQSARAGERIDLHVSHPTAATIGWTVYRLGHYGGTGARQVTEAATAQAGPQAEPTPDPATGLVECRWPSTFGLTVGADWLSGVYVVKLGAPDGSARHVPFIVRDERKVDVLLVMPTATDQAYNAWGGESLYADAHLGLPVGHAYAVSFDRPIEQGFGGGIFLHSSMPTARYLEANGYDVAYVTDQDVHTTPAPLSRARVVLSLGHDEYWSKTMRDHFDAARDGGTSLGFLGANIAYWQVRFEAGPDGMPARRMIGYKEAADLDPVQGPENTGALRDGLLDRPENALLGVMTVDWHMVDYPWVVTNPGHWLYQGLSASEGDLWPAVVGLESDGLVDNGRAPAGLALLADSPTLGGHQGRVVQHHASVYETPAGGVVFAAGSIRFAARLSGLNAHVGPQRIVRNLIARAGGKPAGPEDTLQAGSAFPAADLSKAAAQVTTIAGQAGAPGYADGPGAAARFSSPMGLALAPDGALIVADAGNRRIRRIDPGPARTVTTLAGSGELGDDDGPADKATFRTVWAVAVEPDNTVYVTDTRGGTVRKIDAGVVSTVAGPNSFAGPTGLALAPDGTLHVADYKQKTVKQVSPAGVVTPMPFSGTGAGSFGFLSGLALIGDDLIIVDSGNRTLRRRDPSGALSRIAGDFDSFFADGNGTQARLAPMLGVVPLGPALLVADAGNYRLRIVEPGATAEATTVRTFAGRAQRSSADGPGADAGFVAPTGLAYDAARNLVYVADTGNATIRAITP
jgi:DNA-binding beta-propeller fold protein YncE